MSPMYMTRCEPSRVHHNHFGHGRKNPTCALCGVQRQWTVCQKRHSCGRSPAGSTMGFRGKRNVVETCGGYARSEAPRPALGALRLTHSASCTSRGITNHLGLAPAMSELHARMRRGRDLSPAGPRQKPAVPRARARRGLAADPAHAARHPESRPALGRHDLATIPTATS